MVRQRDVKQVWPIERRVDPDPNIRTSGAPYSRRPVSAITIALILTFIDRSYSWLEEFLGGNRM